MFLSYKQPWEANKVESGEKAKLLIPTLCNLSLCLIYLVANSQIIISAGKPGNVFWALSRYFPSGEILIAKFNDKDNMRFYCHVHEGMFVIWLKYV